MRGDEARREGFGKCRTCTQRVSFLVFFGTLVRFDEAHGLAHTCAGVHARHSRGVGLGWAGRVHGRDFGKKGDYVKCIYVQPAIGRATNAQNVQDMATIGGVWARFRNNVYCCCRGDPLSHGIATLPLLSR
jgi:hypothetical protein